MFERIGAWVRGRAQTSTTVTTATVVDTADPAAEGRVLVELGKGDSRWARTATLMAGPDRGTWFIPAVGEEVLVLFEDGNPRRPVVVGSLWSSTARPPTVIGGATDPQAIVTRSGARIVLDDLRVTIADSAGNVVELGPSGISMTAVSKVEVQAPIVRIETPFVSAAGVLTCTTLVADNVVASNYTPGAGNVW